MLLDAKMKYGFRPTKASWLIAKVESIRMLNQHRSGALSPDGTFSVAALKLVACASYLGMAWGLRNDVASY